MDQLTDRAKLVRWSLLDPVVLCEKLGWLHKGFKRQARGVIIRCPVHGEHDPSCSITTAKDGTIRAKCFSCDWSGDALTMIAQAHGLNTSTDFKEILALGAEYGGNLGLADELRGNSGSETVRSRPRLAPVAPQELETPEYPLAGEVASLWADSAPVASDGVTVRLLMSRGVNFERVTEAGIAHVLQVGQILPPWARYRGRDWYVTGHRLIVPAWDHLGRMASVRSWRIIDGDSPKRLPPGGHRASELVQANRMAVMMLRRWVTPRRLYIVEGEPDFLVAATTFGTDDAVIGIGSGSWTENFARRVPCQTEVIVCTHADDAGDRYAENVIETLGERCQAWRWRMTA